MKDYKQNKDKNEKSLPKETCIKTINGERHGAVAGNASAKNLNRSGSERLNRFALTHSDSAAKLQQKTETTKKKVQNLINNGYSIKSAATEVDIVRNLSKALSIRKSDRIQLFQRLMCWFIIVSEAAGMCMSTASLYVRCTQSGSGGSNGSAAMRY